MSRRSMERPLLGRERQEVLGVLKWPLHGVVVGAVLGETHGGPLRLRRAFLVEYLTTRNAPREMFPRQENASESRMKSGLPSRLLQRSKPPVLSRTSKNILTNSRENLNFANSNGRPGILRPLRLNASC